MSSRQCVTSELTYVCLFSAKPRLTPIIVSNVGPRVHLAPQPYQQQSLLLQQRQPQPQNYVQLFGNSRVATHVGVRYNSRSNMHSQVGAGGDKTPRH